MQYNRVWYNQRGTMPSRLSGLIWVGSHACMRDACQATPSIDGWMWHHDGMAPPRHAALCATPCVRARCWAAQVRLP